MMLFDETHHGTRITLETKRGEEEELVIAGQDIGDAPLAPWGELDYEYWFVLDAHAERSLVDALADTPAARPHRQSTERLLQQAFRSGFFSDPSDLRLFLERHGIKYGFFNYV